MERFIEYDKNMMQNQIQSKNIVYYDIRRDPFDVYGLYHYREGECFQRLPDDIAERLNHGVRMAHVETAGGRIRFSTNSKRIAIRAEFIRVGLNAKFSPLAIAGFDLYVDSIGESRYYRPFIPPWDVKDGYEEVVEFPDDKKRFLTINFPYHTSVKNVFIGIDSGAELNHGMKYVNEAPIVFYGSSITHGSCASRPGLIYENILSRRLNADYINLGFGGSAIGEEIIARYMADLKMCMFVSDYDYNASEQILLESHKRLYNVVREKNPELPYLMISKPDFCFCPEKSRRRREIIFDTYTYACNLSDKNVYYIDGSSLFRGRDWDNCFVDHIHPNDFGFVKMADAIEPIISKVFSEIREQQ